MFAGLCHIFNPLIQNFEGCLFTLQLTGMVSMIMRLVSVPIHGL